MATAVEQINKLDTKGWWKVGNSPLYTPATPCKIEHSNITGSSTGRSEDGVMRIDWVRRDMRKVYYTLKAVTAGEIAYLEDLMQGKEFTLTFRDKSQTQTMQAYCGESNYEFYTYHSGEEIYINFSLNIVEL